MFAHATLGPAGSGGRAGLTSSRKFHCLGPAPPLQSPLEQNQQLALPLRSFDWFSTSIVAPWPPSFRSACRAPSRRHSVPSPFARSLARSVLRPPSAKWSQTEAAVGRCQLAQWHAWHGHSPGRASRASRALNQYSRLAPLRPNYFHLNHTRQHNKPMKASEIGALHSSFARIIGLKL